MNKYKKRKNERKKICLFDRFWSVRLITHDEIILCTSCLHAHNVYCSYSATVAAFFGAHERMKTKKILLNFKRSYMFSIFFNFVFPALLCILGQIPKLISYASTHLPVIFHQFGISAGRASRIFAAAIFHHGHTVPLHFSSCFFSLFRSFFGASLSSVVHLSSRRVRMMSLLFGNPNI